MGRLLKTLGLVGASMAGLCLASSSARAQLHEQANAPEASYGGGFVQSPYANPFLNPLLNPLANPQGQLDPTAAGFYALQLHQAQGGIGSGRISGARPQRSAGSAAAGVPTIGVARGGGSFPHSVSGRFGGSENAAAGRAEVGPRRPSFVATGRIPGAGASQYFQRGLRQSDQTRTPYTRKGGFFQNYGY